MHLTSTRKLFLLLLIAPLTAGIGRCHDGVVDSRAIGAIMLRFSDDGESLACSYQGAIWRIDRPTGRMTRLTKTGEEFDIEPAWSPDRKRIAYLRSTSLQNGQLALINAATGEPIEVPGNVSGNSRLYFDSDGRRILGSFRTGTDRPRLAWYDIATGQLSDAVSDSGLPDFPGSTMTNRHRVFALTSDQKSIALVTSADVPGEQSGNQGPQNVIWRVSLQGGPPGKIITWPARIHEICWSADDQSLIVATERGGVHHDLWRIPVDSPDSGARRLTFAQADESSPDCSADGRWMCYTDNRFGPTMMFIRDLATNRDSVVEPSEQDFGSDRGVASLRILGDDSQPITARITVRHAGGKQFAPPGSMYRLSGRDLHFYTAGKSRFDLPEGHFTVSAIRGPESNPATAEFEIRRGQETKVELKVTRWTNQRAEGWISGETHIHANYGYGHWYCGPDSMLLQCDGEDLTVANFMVANSDGNGVFDREFFLGRPDPHSTGNTILYWNEEFRATIWGHMNLLSLKYLVEPFYTGFKNTTQPYDSPTNAWIADHVHDQNGHVNYTHPAQNPRDPYDGAYTAKELPVDVALGKVDSMDIMGNQNANMVVWYRLLNCGLKIPAAAGTDCFLNRIPSVLPGAVRVYVHCPGEFSYDTWIQNLRAGRTFVTNGPVLRFTVNGQEAGSILTPDSPRTNSMLATVTSRVPIDSLELIINGKPAAIPIPGGAPSKSITVEQRVELTQSGWIAFRASGSSGAFVHSGPIYVTIGDTPGRSPEDAQYFVEWIERLRADVERRNQLPVRLRPQVDEMLDQASAFYKQQAGTVN